MAAGWSPAAVTSARIGLAAVLLVPVVAVLRPCALRFRRTDLSLLFGPAQLGGALLLLTGAVVVQLADLDHPRTVSSGRGSARRSGGCS